MEMDVVKNLMLVLFMERNVLEADIAGHFRQDNRLFGFLNRRLLVVHFVDFAVTADRGGKVVGQPAEHFHRPYDIGGILYECAECAERQLSLQE